ncbi:MAG TPA: helical backbone metal receptor [Acidimicrobiia bacterium]|nr:helical backbone metal receptor [Acidimicrobiia bacterium]
MRVVSLVPSATETLIALGVRPVGCTRFCDVDGVATVGGTKNVDIAAVVALAPDLVVVNDEENRVEDAHALVAQGLVLHSMSPRSVVDVGPAVRELATAVGAPVPHPFGEWERWQKGTRQPAGRVSAFVPIWRRPWMSLAGDTYGSALLEHIGIRNIFAEADDRYPEVALAEVATREPDVALLPSEPYAFTERHAAEVRDALPGVRTTLVDGRDLFWWGIRTPAAAERLRQVV